IVQMPKGIPVATVAIGNAANAGILAIQILATHDDKISKKLEAFRSKQSNDVKKTNIALKAKKLGK
ncbi:MAG: AIR carboxylase family protein, partial [Bdellovibrionales bacterium]|nr:AIR carboxylase family protein [Bdellovibrionales bacterium]